MATQFERFKETLEKMLMLDQADLDFGIYRIMNQKRTDIEKYLNNNLKRQVADAVSNSSTAEVEAVKKEINTLVKTLSDAGVNPEDSPKVKELRAKLAEGGDTESLENEVYSHLTTFFSRYYDGGDFISQRRYKKDVYAIPYEGEEVKLHWANADQYYIKTSEYFRSYRFTLRSGKAVEFTLKEASSELNNNRAQNNMERRFALYEEQPIEVVGDTLHINFRYELYPKTENQKDFIVKAYDTVKDSIPSAFMDVLELKPTDKDKNRTLLQKHLNNYVARNTFDYFIHKDLYGFLTRELDFYIKNEILVIDDIDAKHPKDFVQHLFVIKAIKTVGNKIITFLASLENFQKKLWLKKKFVVQADYCITLDRVPEELYPEICKNNEQREEWVNLFAINEIQAGVFTHAYSEPLTEDFLKENPFLVLDTAFFSSDFKNQLLSEIDNIDEQCDGLLINSENLQALGLLQEKYQNKINCEYIDPPYNTDATKIAYKNGYEHSSWLSLMDSRLQLGRNLLRDTGVIEAAIDDYELRYLNCCMECLFGTENFISNIAIYTNPKGRDQGFIAQAHDYSVVYAKNKRLALTYNFKLSEEDLKKKYSKSKGDESVRELPLKRTGSEKFREDRPYMFFPFLYHKATKKLSVINKDEYIGIYNNDTKLFNDNYVSLLKTKYEQNGYAFILPVSQKGEFLRWRWGYDSCVDGCDSGTLFCKESKTSFAVYQYDSADEEVTPKSIWIGERYDASSKGTNLLNDIIPNNPFDYPKSLYTVEDNLILGSAKDGLVLDFFAGSGTTGHAVIELNRNTDTHRKYILIDMADYFSTVLRPRIERVIYSKDWNNGQPVSREGSSHCFKYMRLEQYEDTLNNLVVKSPMLADDNGEFYDGYVLGYLLDTETKDSLFNLEWFRNPWKTKLFITRQNETKEETIDLVETFNYLIGLNVKTIRYPKDGICTVEGETRTGERTLVIWRNVDEIDNESLNTFFEKQAYPTKDSEFDRIYVNGDNNLENLRSDKELQKVVLIEKEFAKRMFEDC
ncbi:site-specific DNA-methyltransferase [Prevotella corporis]|uniref:site-specific DNA-methyltransferase n=1 Tax=Prevotella corporis TaxID=28128 RepID=UPI0023654395|nr:site-specific DNA-methyltransferase [Prevotella corporis]